VPETSKTVSQALCLLIEIGEKEGSVADLARRVGLQRTIVQRLLSTLREQRFVFRTPDGRFVLGSAVSELATRMENPVQAVAAAPMLTLSRQLNETVVLTVRDRDDAVSVDQIGAVGHVVRAEYPPGFRHPLSVAAAGRAILSLVEPATIARFVAAAPDGEELRAKLAVIGQLGYAVSVDELRHGAAGLAAPIVDRSGYAIGSIGIITPSGRFPNPDSICEFVLRAAAEISGSLCG
jgi:DNA-binding IclR family transcriptional regulator